MSTLRRSGRLALGVMALALVHAGTAVAADDGGTRSVFSYGAGNRALAMGGAFVACPDDASAQVWNPGGLALVQRTEVQASQSAQLGLDAREAYGAIVVPGWRWGSAGLVIRTFGVSGIEQRDDRNVPLPGDLNDSETEMALGFGRAVGSAWGLGGTVKVQHQSLAGFSSSGLGLDLGLTVKPGLALGLGGPSAQRWSMGVAVRNAVAPSLRLDRESVPDPVTVRAGLAYRVPLTAGWVLGEADVEQAPHVAARLHAGLELQPAPVAALRVGVDGSHLTTGAGLRWRDLSVDYAFEDNPLGASHRAGVSLHFGPTVDESRRAARRAEDEAMQRRLADAFQRRESEQVAALLESAEVARREARYDDALEALGVALALEPGGAAATKLERDCLVAKAAALERAGDLAAAVVTYDLALGVAKGDSVAAAGAARCRNESDRRARRSVQIRERFARAMDAFANGDLVAARSGFAAVLAGDSTDVDAREMHARATHAIGRQAAALLEQANRQLRVGATTDAATLLDQVAALDPSAAGLAAARAELARARRAAPAVPVPASTATRSAPSSRAGARPPAPGQQLSDREIAALYQHGLEALKAQRTSDALRYWELVWSARPDYRGVAEYLKREYLTRGMDAFAAGRLDDAISEWEKVLRLDPADARARGYLQRAQQQAARSREILGVNR